MRRGLLPARLRPRAHGALVRSATAGLRALPLLDRLQAIGAAHDVVLLDYPAHDIRLHADTAQDLRRARACTKEPHTVAWVEEHLQAGDVLFDIGANVGAYSLVAAAQGHEKVEVHAFEPSFATYAQLCRNVVLNGAQDVVRPWMLALGAATEVASFNYQSIEAGTSLHALGESIDYLGHAFVPAFEQRVIGFSIDDLVQRYDFPVPNLIKLDVDGTEFDVLKGARATLADEAVRSVILEVCPGRTDGDAVIELLGRCGMTGQVVREGDGLSDYVFTRS